MHVFATMQCYVQTKCYIPVLRVGHDQNVVTHGVAVALANQILVEAVSQT